jgi:DNA-binding IclR family transcriptional regulator
MNEHPNPTPRRPVTTLDRAFQLLAAFRDAGGPLGNGDLAAITGLPKPTISRLARALVEAGYLEYVPRVRQYQLGVAILALSRAKLSAIPIRRIARPHMRQLAMELGLTVDLGTPVDGDVLYLDFARADALLTANADVGGRNPLDVTAAGRACLAVMSPAERRRAYDILARRRGEDWPMIRERIEASLLEMKRLGFCVVEREFRPENAFAGVALRDDKQGQIYSFAGGVIGESAAKSNQLLYAKVGPGLLRLLALVSDELGQ